MKAELDLTPKIVSTEIANQDGLVPSESGRLFKLDANALSRISALIPVVSTLPATQLYSVTIPAGQELIKVAGKSHAFRGLFHSTAAGARGISGHVEMVGLSPAATVGAVMSAASFAVGQYYMHEINQRLESVDKKLDAIIEFQKLGFASKVSALVTRVQQYQITAGAFIEDDDERQTALIHLNDEQKTASELLDQVLMTLKKRQVTDINLKAYKEATGEINSLLHVQQSLLQVMSLIAHMTALQNARPTERQEADYGLFNTYLARAVTSQNQLQTWHLSNAERLQIDLTSSVQRRDNLLTKISARVKAPDVIQTRLATKKLNDNLMQNIVNQLDEDFTAVNEIPSDQPTRILLRNGSAYLQI
jgi:hypothetical protein